MGNFSKIDALLGELEPYSPSLNAIKKSLLDVGVLDETAEYSDGDKKTIALAAISVLKKLIVLSSDAMSQSSQGYNTQELKNRIKQLCKDNGLDPSDFLDIPTITDGSNLW